MAEFYFLTDKTNKKIMFGLGSLIGGAMKIGGSIFGGINASRAMKAVEKSLNNQMRENQDWYDRRYNEDATQRADAQRMLAMTMDAIRDRSYDAKGTQAVMGGTEESLAATKAANANALADTAANIAVAGAARKDQIENQYMNKKDAINDKLNNLKISGAKSINEAFGKVNEAAVGITGNSVLNDIVLGKSSDAGNSGVANSIRSGVNNVMNRVKGIAADAKDTFDTNYFVDKDGNLHQIR